jgi:hypothetical protein
LGEIVTQEIIGEIKIEKDRFTHAMPLTELPEFVKRVMREQDGRRTPPVNCGPVYRLKEAHSGHAPRRYYRRHDALAAIN